MKKLLVIVPFLIMVLLVPFALADNHDIDGESSIIPSWVKGVAYFWVVGNIGDSEFIRALEFLIDNEIIEIPGYEKIINTEEIIELQPMVITVTTDKETYQINEPVIISGTVQNNDSGTVTIIIVNSSNDIMTITQISSTSSGTYTKTLLTENLSSGMYKVKVQYDSEKIETSFSLS